MAEAFLVRVIAVVQHPNAMFSGTKIAAGSVVLA